MLKRLLSNVFLSIASIVFLASAQVSARAVPETGSPERVLFDSTNRERAAHGLHPLRWDDALASAARQHAQAMAQRNALSHQFPGEPAVQERVHHAGAQYTMVAENVAEGPTAAGIHTEWMHSPHHRANILNPDLNAIGIAVSERGRQLFAVQDFSRQGENLSYSEQEKQVAKMLTARGLRVSSDAAAEVRKACSAGRRFTPSKPGALVRWEDSDLTHLPDNLLQNIRTGRYHTAAVAACDPGATKGFTRFRVAVFLY